MVPSSHWFHQGFRAMVSYQKFRRCGPEAAGHPLPGRNMGEKACPLYTLGPRHSLVPPEKIRSLTHTS